VLLPRFELWLLPRFALWLFWSPYPVLDRSVEPPALTPAFTPALPVAPVVPTLAPAPTVLPF